jgi:hypothetical protein
VTGPGHPPPPGESGYGFVELPRSVRRVGRDEARWDRRVPGTVTGCIDLTLIAEQPVHVGSGAKAAHQDKLVLRGACVRGGPGIPGSSLKGVLRARYEAITLSCARPPRTGIHKINSSTGIKKAVFRPAYPLPAACSDDCTEHQACPACALFGCMSLRGRITVTDLGCASGATLAIVAMPERFGPNLHHVGPARRDASGEAFVVSGLYGRKFGLGRGPSTPQRQAVEVIPAGTVMTGQIRMFNVTAAELGGLRAALGIDPYSRLKVGGGKAHGFGRMRCEASYRLAGTGSLEPSEWRARFLASPDRWADGEAQLVELHDGGC